MTPALQLRGLQKRFGATEVLRGIDLAVRDGECVALIGPNGAGKSTLFDAVSGHTPPSAGEVLLHGRPIGGQAPQRIRRQGLARSFQITQLFGTLDARDHLRCALDGAGARQGSWLRRTLRPFDRDPAAEAAVRQMLQRIGLESRADVPAALLSYAEQRALEIGLAFSGEPTVVLLDEPTAGMSQDETRQCVKRIRDLGAGRTVLVVEHDMDVVFGLADRVAVLAQGRIVAFDTPAAVRADPAVLQAYVGAGMGDRNAGGPDRC